MKKLFLLMSLWAVIAVSAFAQSSAVTVREESSGVSVPNVRNIIFPNGSLTVSGRDATVAAGSGSGTVTSISVVTANGVSASCATCTTTPALTFVLGAITPTTVNGLTVTSTTSGVLTIANSKTFTVSNTLTFTGTDSSSVAFGAGGTVAYVANKLSVFAATTSAELAGVLSDENGTGAALFNAATTPTFTTGIQIGGAAASRKILVGNGTNFVPSTETWAVPGTSGNVLTSDGTNWTSAAPAGGGLTVGTTTVASGTATRLLYETSGNVVGEISGATSDGTNVTFGSGNLLATLPQITTGWNDANGNRILGITATSSATEYITVANNTATNAVSLTASSPTQGTSAIAGTPFNLIASPAIAGNTNAGAAAGGNVTITSGAAARLTSGNANGGNINLVTGAGIGTGVTGQVLVPSGAVSGTNANSFGFTGSTTTGLSGISNTLYLWANATQIIGMNSTAFIVNSGARYSFSSGTPSTNAADLSLVRSAAGVLRIADASTGAGSLVLGTSTVGSVGTSGVGVLAIANGTAPTSSPADTAQHYTADSAAGDANAFARNEAGEINRLTGLAARNSSSFAKTTDTTLANITGLTRNVEAGRAYAFTATLQTTAAATGGVKFAVSGTATATSISYEGVLVDTAVGVAQTRATALDTTVCASTTSTAGTCTIKGVIVVNAAGTLTIQFAQNASDGSASTVLVNQYMQLIPIS